MMNRREMLKIGSAALLTATGGAVEAAEPKSGSYKVVERWDFFEETFAGPNEGNPFLDVWIRAVFRKDNREVWVDGFYDGDGTYKVRFMPDETGVWTSETDSNVAELKGRKNTLKCIEPQARNHGPVRVRDSYHFGYADGTPYFPFGTTCYAWVHQTEELQRQTLESLRTGPFNKIRMCIFPKWYQYNHGTPPRFPFPRVAETNDYTYFNPEFFRHIEGRIGELRAMNVEADLILFHPYDHWGFQAMPADVDDRYLKYVIARFAAYRNVWWSLANEFDLMRKKNNADWDRYARIVTETDPYSHLRSIHYSHAPYDYSRAWCTHAGVQDYAFDKAAQWRTEWRKPVIFDECMYEGNINSRWGNLSGEEMVRRFWLCTVAGVYGGHGETYVGEDEIENDSAILWWSHGGVLKGTSSKRIGFLRKLLEEIGTEGGGRIGLEAIQPVYYLAAKRSANETILWYFDFHQPSYYDFSLPEGAQFKAEWIDPWEMTTKTVDGLFTGKSRIKLPGKPYQAIVFRKV
jgi:hypothetical protein